MTNEQILKLADTCGVNKRWDENLYKCREDQLLKFALAIHENGYNEGYDQGCFEATGGQ